MSFFMTINGKRVEARDGEYVLATARRAGIPIPTLCDHPAVEPFGSCRLCIVEVTRKEWKGWKGLMTACLYPSAEGLVVETNSDRVKSVRRDVLDLLLARCPDSRLIQQLAAGHGVSRTSFTQRANPDLCILCGLCVRVCEAAATSAIATTNRGIKRKVGSPWGESPPDCIGCLSCAHICPTGEIAWTDTGLVRRIWGREFAFASCLDCGRLLPVTKEQATFLAKRQGLDASYFERCEKCQRSRTAATMGRIARWDKLGLKVEGGAA